MYYMNVIHNLFLHQSSLIIINEITKMKLPVEKITL